MASLIDDFERDCADAGIAPAAVIKAAGLHPSTWFRWRAGDVSPTMRSFEAARAKLNEHQRAKTAPSAAA